jgi:transposase, IS30 family
MREIARRLKRSPSSISAEIRRNRPAGEIYHSIRAQQAAEIRKRQCRKKYLLATKRTLKAYVLEKLAAGWSPEQIAGRLKKEIREGSRPHIEYINHESIYQYVYNEEQRPRRLWEAAFQSAQKTTTLAGAAQLESQNSAPGVN